MNDWTTLFTIGSFAFDKTPKHHPLAICSNCYRFPRSCLVCREHIDHRYELLVSMVRRLVTGQKLSNPNFQSRRKPPTANLFRGLESTGQITLRTKSNGLNCLYSLCFSLAKAFIANEPFTHDRQTVLIRFQVIRLVMPLLRELAQSALIASGLTQT